MPDWVNEVQFLILSRLLIPSHHYELFEYHEPPFVRKTVPHGNDFGRFGNSNDGVDEGLNVCWEKRKSLKSKCIFEIFVELGVEFW